MIHVAGLLAFLYPARRELEYVTRSGTDLSGRYGAGEAVLPAPAAPLLGMLLAGILLGPHVLGLLDERILLLSSDLRRIALLIILTRAGLNLRLEDLRRVGRPY